MNNILNKIILLIGSALLLIENYDIEKAILPILVTVAITCFLEYLNKDKLNLIALIVYSIICILYPEFLMGIPIIFYDAIFSKYKYICILILIPCTMNIHKYPPIISIMILGLLSTSVILKFNTVKYENLHDRFIKQRDDLTEISIVLEDKVKKLQYKQDFEVNFATLKERNRISREIHDNVGHLLTSSILQIGAIMAITKEDQTKGLLEDIKSTLDQGMDSIRSSIHNLHEDSIDLYVQLSKLINEFKFCKATLNYEFSSNPDVKIKYAIIAIVKEALSNIIKHSNATAVTVSLYEHPKLYQVIILDDGTKKKSNMDNSGMGLQSIEKRVSSLNGIVNFDNAKGFKIFISIMKEGEL
jgi:signal transduction histidine kinase